MKTFNENSYYIGNVQNPRNLYEFKDGSILQFNKGKFDDYRVTYFPTKKNMKYGFSPKDADYFADLLELEKEVGYEVIWGDFMTLSDMVKTNGLQNNGLPDYSMQTISAIRISLNTMVDKYPNNLKKDTYKLFLTLWTVMVSEWYHTYNGRPSILKHTPKIIGSYQTLRKLFTPEDSAKFSRTDIMMDEFLLQYYPDYDLILNRSSKLKTVMDIYKIDYSWLT